MAGHPGTIYGVYKRANESTAAVYLGRERRLEHRPAAAHGLRRRPRPGRDLGADDRDARRGRRRRLHDPVRRRRPSCSSRATSRARSSPRASPAARARRCTTCRGRASRSRRRRGDRRRRARERRHDRLRRRARCRSPRRSTARSFAELVPGFAETPLARRRRGDRRPLSRALLAEGPRRTRPERPVPTTRSVDEQRIVPQRLGGAVRQPEPEDRLRRPQLQRPHGRVGLEAAEGAAPVRQVRQHAVRGRRHDRAAARGRPRRRRGRARGRDRPHRAPRRAGRRARRSSPATRARTTSAHRDFQFGDGQWFRGKSFDTFCPVGPRVVPRGELDAVRPAHPAAPERRDRCRTRARAS